MIEATTHGTPTHAVAEYLAAQAVAAGVQVPVYANGYLPGGGEPQISVQRVGGADPAVLMQVDVWGVTEPETEQLAGSVATWLDALVGYTSNGVHLAGSSKPDVRFFPDEASPRYILDVTVHAASTT